MHELLTQHTSKVKNTPFIHSTIYTNVGILYVLSLFVVVDEATDGVRGGATNSSFFHDRESGNKILLCHTYDWYTVILLTSLHYTNLPEPAESGQSLWSVYYFPLPAAEQEAQICGEETEESHDHEGRAARGSS